MKSVLWGLRYCSDIVCRFVVVCRKRFLVDECVQGRGYEEISGLSKFFLEVAGRVGKIWGGCDLILGVVDFINSIIVELLFSSILSHEFYLLLIQKLIQKLIPLPFSINLQLQVKFFYLWIRVKRTQTNLQLWEIHLTILFRFKIFLNDFVF